MARGWLILFFIVFLLDLVSGLGISPAIVEFDFVPGAEHEVTYSVHSESPQQEIEVFTGGDLGQYVSLSTKNLIGSGDFKVIIKFPESIEVPGEHRIAIGARELPSEEEFIGTAVEIIGVIKVNVPYPGKYLELDLNIKDGNVNEQIPIEAYVVNRGKEDLNVNVNIGFYRDLGLIQKGELVNNIQFKPAFIKVGEERYFRKLLDTNDFRAGNYIAEVIVNYGEEKKTSRKFKVGSLFVNITNFTAALPKGSIQKFFVEVESMWNNELSSVYADINVYNTTKILEFRTPAANLERWEKKILVGFLDTNGLEGEYDMNITIYYEDAKTLANGKLIVYETGLNYKLIGIFIAIALAFLVIVVLLFFRKKRKT